MNKLLLFLNTKQNILNGNLKSLHDKRCILNDKNLLIYSFYSLVLINRIQKERYVLITLTIVLRCKLC